LKRVACLACGPSLPFCWGQVKGERWDAVVAVNTAGWLYACDWLAFADPPIAAPILAGECDAPRAGYLTHPRTPLPSPGARAAFPLKQPGVICRYAEFLPHGEDPLCCAYTFPNALAFSCGLAALLPGEVHVYGMDFAAQQGDVCGVGGDHKLGRWLSELPWIKHAWYLLTPTAHGNAPGAVVAWLENKEQDRRGYRRAVEALRERCEAEKMC
jgi:hypothetical protein